MKKWLIVAYPDEEMAYHGHAVRKEKEVYAKDEQEATEKGFREFPEYHEIGAYEIEEK